MGSGRKAHVLVNRTTGETLASQVRVCDTFWRRFRGLMFRPALNPDEVYVFGYPRESIVDTSITMFFVFYPIAVLWLDAGHRVVDKVLAKPFQPYYVPRQPAQYFIEGVPGLLARARLGDELSLGESSE